MGFEDTKTLRQCARLNAAATRLKTTVLLRIGALPRAVAGKKPPNDHTQRDQAGFK